jgi:hypothetical protein
VHWSVKCPPFAQKLASLCPKHYLFPLASCVLPLSFYLLLLASCPLSLRSSLLPLAYCPMTLHNEGKYACFLVPKGVRPKGGSKHEYGVLLHDFEADCICGTFLMGDGRLLTVAGKELHKAFKRIREYAFEITQTEITRTSLVLKKEQEDLPVFDEKITQSEDRYFTKIGAPRALRNQASANMTVDVQTTMEIGLTNCDQVQGEHKAQ